MKEKENMNKEECQQRLSNVSSWINNADGKIATGLGIFSFSGLFISFVFADKFGDLIKLKETCCFVFWLIIVVFTLSLLAFLVALGSFVFGIVPRFNSSTDKPPKKRKKRKINGGKVDLNDSNLWFYKHVALFPTFDSFYKECEKRCGKIDDECKQLLEEVYHNSQICYLKMKTFRIGIIISFISVVLSVISVLTIIFASICVA